MLFRSRYQDVLADIDRWVATDPWRERLRMQWMIALYAELRAVEAVQVYNEYRAALVERFGIEPGHDMQELQRAILGQDQSLLCALESFRGVYGSDGAQQGISGRIADSAVRLVAHAKHLTDPEAISVVREPGGGRTWLVVEASGVEAAALSLAVGGETLVAPDLARALGSVRTAESDPVG